MERGLSYSQFVHMSRKIEHGVCVCVRLRVCVSVRAEHKYSYTYMVTDVRGSNS